MEVMAKRLAQHDVFANIRDWAPDDLLSFLDQVVLLLPEDVRFRLKRVIDSLAPDGDNRSEEHTSELQSRRKLVCRLRLEKKKKNYNSKKGSSKAWTQPIP